MVEAPSDEAIVLRFSPMSPERLLEKAEEERTDSGCLGLSVFCREPLEGDSLDRLLERVCNEAPVNGKKVWLATAGDLRGSGLTLRHAPPPADHYLVDLGDDATLEDVARFVEAFAPPRRNPAWKRSR